MLCPSRCSCCDNFEELKIQPCETSTGQDNTVSADRANHHHQGLQTGSLPPPNNTITGLEQQVFGLPGYQRALIIISILHITVVVLGLLGEFCRSCLIVSRRYLLCTSLWVGWNVLISCLYLDLGDLSKAEIMSEGIR